MHMRSRLSKRLFRRLPLAPSRVEFLQPRQMLSVTLNADGWTDVGRSIDTQVIYVSSTAGNDVNDGLSEATPVKTVARGKGLLRNGMPDQLLLKRGDAWYESLSGVTWGLSGRNADEPMFVGSYGDAAAPRPVLRTGAGRGFDLNGGAVHDVVIKGLHFHAQTRDPDSSEYTGNAAGDVGLRLIGSVQRLLVEDNLVEAYQENVSVNDFNGRHADVRLRRNVIADAYANAAGGRSQGIYVDGADRVTLEGNLFDHNGWEPRVSVGAANIYSHNVYVSENNTAVVVRDNVIADASSHGLQARSGGTITGNLFLRNPIHMSFGFVNGAAVKAGGVTGTVADNVFLDARDINGSKRGWAIEASNIKAGGGTSFHNNVFANDATQRANAAVVLSYGSSVTNSADAVGINDLTIRDNVVYDWYRAVTTNSGLVPGGTGYNALNGLVVTNNDVQEVSAAQLVSHGGPYTATAERWDANRYFDSTAPSSGWFTLNGATLSMASWQAQVEATAQQVKLDYTDPGRDAAEYNQSIGGTASLSAFLAQCRGQSQATWRPAYTAGATNTYVRDGYSLTPAVPNVAPTVTTLPTATPTPATGQTTALSVRGADDAGEANLTYTWSATGPSPVTFNVNGSNAAKDATATFSKAGVYTFTVTLRDAGGLTASDSVTVTVNQTLTAVDVTPAVVSLVAGATQQFRASAVDQFGQAMATQPSFIWSVASGGGTVDNGGLYTAPAGAGSATVQAVTVSGPSDTAAVTIVAAPAAPSGLTAVAASGSQVTLAWADNSSDEEGFHVERSTDGTTFTQVATVGVNVTSYPATGLSAGTTYSFRVRAYNVAGASGYSGNATATTPATPSVLQQNTVGGAKVDVKRGQKGAQSFRHGTAGTTFTVTKLVLHVSREQKAPNANLVVSIGTGINAGALAGSTVSIAPSTITNTSAGSTFQTVELTFASPLTLEGGKLYFLNFQCEAANGKAFYLEYASNDTYAAGTYYKGGSNDGKDVWFQMFGF